MVKSEPGKTVLQDVAMSIQQKPTSHLRLCRLNVILNSNRPTIVLNVLFARRLPLREF